MILVSVGSGRFPFDRLLRAIEQLPPGEELIVQHGSSSVRPTGAMCLDFIPFETMVDYVRDARIVISHAGVGSVLVAFANGKRPLVVPRLSKFGEIVDDHQLEFGRRLAQADLVTLVEDLDELPEAIARYSNGASTELRRGGQLVQELRAYLTTRVRVGPRADSGATR